MSAHHDHADGDSDPLDGADMGETATVTETNEIWLGQLASEDVRGSDRLADHRLVDATVVTDEHGEQSLAVTVESDVTKRLPRRWDACREPRTDSERATARRSRWVSRAITGVSFAIPLGIGLAVTSRVNRQLTGDVTINGEPFTPPTVVEMVPVVALIVVIAAVILGSGLMPGGFGGGR